MIVRKVPKPSHAIWELNGDGRFNKYRVWGRRARYWRKNILSN